MEDDFYEFDEKSYSVIGRRRRKVYTLGDQVRVKIKKTDIDKRTVDLVFARETSGALSKD
jgi:ribonuclease R